MVNYEKMLGETIKSIKPSGIRKFFDLAEKSGDIISLGVGEPDFNTPDRICRAGIETLECGKTKYTSNRGLAELRAEIAKYLQRRCNVSYDPDTEIVITVGGSEAIDAALRSVVNYGDEVIIPQPSFVCYEPLAKLCGAVPVIIETKAEDGFRLKAEDLKKAITDKTKAVILPYPCNPTGAILEREDIEAINDVLEGTDIAVISDEIYSELTYGRDHVSPASVGTMRERTLTINGFSKAYAMTGWRLGYVCGPATVISQLVKIHQYGIMCAPSTAQYAAVVALRDCDDDVVRMREEYDKRRKFVVDGFNAIGLDCVEPNGAFYAFPCIKSTGLSSEDFCMRLIEEKKVAVVPGSAFGDSGEGFVRVSYCYSIDHLKTAIDRIGEFVKELKA